MSKQSAILLCALGVIIFLIGFAILVSADDGDDSPTVTVTAPAGPAGPTQ